MEPLALPMICAISIIFVKTLEIPESMLILKTMELMSETREGAKGKFRFSYFVVE